MNIMHKQPFGGVIVPSFLFYLMESIILVISLSTDAFAAGLAYGASKIKIPNLSSAIISLICSGMLLVSMFAGGIINQFIPPEITHSICFFILFAMGLTKLFDNCIKSYIRKHNSININFATSDLKFVLTVYADVEYADSDNSKILSVKEAAALAAALSLDSLAVGIGAAISGINYILPAIISLILTFIAVKLGCGLGKRLPKLFPFDMSNVSAILLIILAITRLL